MTKDLYSEISSFIAERVKSGAIVNVGWTATDFIKTRGDIDAADYDFWMIAAHDYVTRLMKKAVGKYDARPDSDPDTPPLKGFEHLQVAYTFDRGSEKQLLIPIHLLTDEEIETRALEYDSMADGCRAHAKELRSYLKMRK